MVINLSLDASRLGEGVYAHVFKVGGKAYKLFLAYPSPHSAEKRRSTFQSQCSANQRAAADLELQRHVAAFYGTCPIEDVIDREGSSIRDNYMLDCCYVLEVLTGNNAKVLAVRDKFDHLQVAYGVFRQKGFSLADADVFEYEHPQRFKFVDFDL
jgi:hypothetical protein